MLSVTYHKGINEGLLNFFCLVKVLSEYPAKIFGLCPKKGALQEDSDADIILLDPAQEHVITNKT